MKCKKTFLIVFLILTVLSVSIVLFRQSNLKSKTKEITQNIENNLDNIDVQEEKQEIAFQDGSIGILKIPSLEIEAPICEGTDAEVLKYTIRTFCNNTIMDTAM